MTNILIRNERVIDPYNNIDRIYDIAVQNGKIVPADEYARETIDGKQVVIADQFSFIQQSPVSVLSMLNLIF
ncbi:hypothetical protein [Oscillibacter sp.]|uniref:hypothetical protein n=1 Tax=Oscillibacter sp. TaxID=1945593 RepID=UPI002896A0ED|nr:hypothetical protein [Oscillibacter sp.]